MPVNLGAQNRLTSPVIDNRGLFNPYGMQQQPGTDALIRNAMNMFGRNDLSFLMGGNPGLARPYGPPPTGGLEPNPNAPIQTGGLQPNPNYNRSYKTGGFNPALGGGLAGVGMNATPAPGISRPTGMGGAQNGSGISRPLFQGVGGVSTTRPDIAMQPPRRQQFANPYGYGYGMYGTGM